VKISIGKIAIDNSQTDILRERVWYISFGSNATYCLGDSDALELAQQLNDAARVITTEIMEEYE